MTKSFVVASFGGSELLFPAHAELSFESTQLRSLLPPVTIKRNKLVRKRIEDRAKDRVDLVQYKPQVAAGAVSRLASQAAVIGTTASTPPSPDVVEQTDPLELGGTRKRKSVTLPRPVVLQPVQVTGRLSSIKT